MTNHARLFWRALLAFLVCLSASDPIRRGAMARPNPRRAVDDVPGQRAALARRDPTLRPGSGARQARATRAMRRGMRCAQWPT